MNAWALSFGSAWGSSFGSTPIPPVVLMTTRGGIPERKRERPVSEDIRAAIAELEHVTVCAEAVPVSMPAFVPIHAALIDALEVGRKLVAQAERAVEKTRLQIAIAQAKEARDQLGAREQAALAIKKARRMHAVAFLSAFLS